MKTTPILVNKKTVFKGRFRSVVNKEFKFPNGQVHNFDVINEGRNMVYVAAFNKKKEIILVEQFRPGPEKVLLDLPAGQIEVGEKPLRAAKRELLEETGYKCKKIIKMGESYHWSYSQSKCFFYLALNCEKVQDVSLEDDEHINVKVMKLDKYLKQVKAKGNLIAINGLYLALQHL